MAPQLIINADDCNLTRGVTRAILECHDAGLVTSTTFMINLPIDAKTIQAIKRRKKLGLGLHLNVTRGESVSKRSLLVDENGCFTQKVAQQRTRLSPKLSRAVAHEYRAQLQKFRKVFGQKPTHLDTHHQVHDRDDFLKILLAIAKEEKLPVRRSKRFIRNKNSFRGVRTTHTLLGNLRVNGYWRRKEIETAFSKLFAGVNEVMVHPGYVDTDLKRRSSFLLGRHHERRLFTSKYLRKSIEDKGIQLVNFKMCYT